MEGRKERTDRREENEKKGGREESEIGRRGKIRNRARLMQRYWMVGERETSGEGRGMETIE